MTNWRFIVGAMTFVVFFYSIIGILFCHASNVYLDTDFPLWYGITVGIVGFVYSVAKIIIKRRKK